MELLLGALQPNVLSDPATVTSFEVGEHGGRCSQAAHGCVLDQVALKRTPMYVPGNSLTLELLTGSARYRPGKFD
jgi:hypothetical protein